MLSIVDKIEVREGGWSRRTERGGASNKVGRKETRIKEVMRQKIMGENTPTRMEGVKERTEKEPMADSGKNRFVRLGDNGIFRNEVIL